MACADFFENVDFDCQARRPPAGSNGCFSPRFSFSRDLPGADLAPDELGNNGDEDRAGDADFEFCMALSEDPRSSGAMLSADELFFQGMLRPLQPRIQGLEPLPPVRPEPEPEPWPPNVATAAEDPCSSAVSAPKGSKSSGKWKGLLSFKKLHISAPAPAPAPPSPPPQHKPSAAPSKSLKKLFAGVDSRRFDRATCNADSAEVCTPEEQAPRRSVDSQKEDASLGRSLRVNVDCRAQQERSQHGGRIDKSQACPRKISRRPGAAAAPPLDSPRISASGKIVFRNLERSSSSPGSFSRHARKRGNSFRQFKDERQGLERSYSENIRISPVLHVGISPSLRSVKAVSKGGIFGLGHLFSSPQKKENGGRRTRNSPCPSLSSTSIEGSKIFGL